MSTTKPLKEQINSENKTTQQEAFNHLYKMPNTPMVGELPALLAHVETAKRETAKAGDNVPVTTTIGKSIITSTKINKEIMKDDVGNKEKKNFLQVEFASPKSKSIFSITNIDKFKRNHKILSKILLFLICKAVNVAMSNRELIGNFFSFDIQELVDLNMYSNKDSATKGINNVRDLIPQIKASGTLKVSTKTDIKFEIDEPFFTSISKPQRGVVIVGINRNLNWKEITRFFSIMPEYIFSLNINAFILCHYICYLARQENNMNSITRNHSFTVKTRLIQQVLNLPSELGNEHPTQVILTPIRKAVEEIQKADVKQGERLGDINRCIDLKLFENPSWTPTDFLDRGYLEITPLNHWLDYFLSTLKASTAKKDKAIRIAKKRKEAKDAKKNTADTSTN